MNNNFEINDWVKITMKNKSVICGQIAAFGKKLVEGEEHDSTRYVYWMIVRLQYLMCRCKLLKRCNTNVELQDWVIEIAAKYGI